jgi:hypothetical protein
MSDGAPKSAFELAMERLKKKDAETGEGIRALTAAQKSEIAEIRRVYEAKVAELDILKKPKLPPGLSPEMAEAAEFLDEDYRRERDRLHAERDSKIERVRDRAT